MLMLSSILLMCLSQSTHQISHIQPQGYFDGEMEFADADGDGDLDLFVAVFVDYKRYIDVYLQHENLFATTPSCTLVDTPTHPPIPRTMPARPPRRTMCISRSDYLNLFANNPLTD